MSEGMGFFQRLALKPLARHSAASEPDGPPVGCEAGEAGCALGKIRLFVDW